MRVDDCFTSYNDLQCAINQYEKENRVQFWKRDCKTLESAKNHCPKIFEKANRELKYYIIKYSCIHGGQKFRPNKNNKSIRKHEGTLKQNCPAEINVKVSDDGKSLVIRSMNINHNHEIPTEEIFKHLPKQRRLSDEHKKSVLEMMKLKVNKKLLQAELVEKTGNSILLRDLSNIVKNSQGKDNLQEIISILKEKYHCLIDIQTEENAFRGIFFQDKDMQKCFSLFPEILFLDGTYKLLNNRCPVYVMVIENSFGTTDIVGIAILTKEDSESIGWFLNAFKERNPKWPNIKVIMTDKSAAERDVISKEFPNAKKLICLFHTFQIFQREVTVAKLNITSEEVKLSLEFLNKITYSKSEKDYESILSNMKLKLPDSVIKYFMKNWNPVKQEWVRCFTKYSENFYNFTNNRLESLNAKLKSVISIYSSFDEFINKLFILIKMKRVEKQNEYSKMVLKVPNNLSNVNMQFYKHLTHFAYKQIEKNLIDIQTVDSPFTFQKIDDATVFCIAEKDTIVISEVQCQCSFFISMKLPCKHILFYRKHLGIELFSEDLFDIRWTRKYIENVPGSSLETLSNNGDVPHPDELFELPKVNISSTNILSKRKTLTSHEKFKKAQAVCLKLATLCSEVSTAEFQERMDILIKLEQNWQELGKVQILNVTDTRDNLNRTNLEIQSTLDHSLNTLVDHNYFNQCDMPKPNERKGLHELEINQDFQEVLELQEETVQEIICDMDYDDTENDISFISNITLPSTIKQRGRPKGRSLTTIGLPRKRKKLQ